MIDIREKAAKIKSVIFDMDGVLTDGGLLFDERGGEYKNFHPRDGLGLNLLRKTGVEVAVTSRRTSHSASRRMGNLGIERAYPGYDNKLLAFGKLRQELGPEPEPIAHVGDDWLDLPLTRGIGVAVADAHPAIPPFAHGRPKNPAGLDAAREVCGLIMEAQGNLQRMIESYY